MRRPHRQLTSTLTQTLQAKASQVHVSPAATPFDPTRPPPLDEELPADDLRGRRRLFVPAAVVVVVALVGAALAAGLLGRDDDRSDTSTAETTTTTAPPEGLPVPEGALVPTWTPEGMDLWSVGWIQTQGLGGHTYQLFGDPDAGRSILVWFQPDQDPQTGTGGVGDPVTVRGQSGVVQPAKYFPDTTSTLMWDESGAAISASFRGMSTEEAVAALDTLEWRSASYQDGFAESSGGSLPLRGETGAGQAGATLTAEYWYTEGVPHTTVDGAQRQLLVRTTTASGQMSSDYLEDWFYGTREEGGPSQSFEAEFGTLNLSWPDGRAAYVDAARSPVARVDIERVAGGIRPGSHRDLRGLLAEADANAVALPRLAAADTSSLGTLVVHGQDGFDRLCRATGDRGDPREVDCGARASLAVPAEAGQSAVSNYVVDGTWYVAVGSDGPGPAMVGSLPGLLGQGIEDYVREAVSAGPWHFVVAEIPDGVDDVMVDVPVPDGSAMGGSVRRPGR